MRAVSAVDGMGGMTAGVGEDHDPRFHGLGVVDRAYVGTGSPLAGPRACGDKYPSGAFAAKRSDISIFSSKPDVWPRKGISPPRWSRAGQMITLSRYRAPETLVKLVAAQHVSCLGFLASLSWSLMPGNLRVYRITRSGQRLAGPVTLARRIRLSTQLAFICETFRSSLFYAVSMACR